MLLFSLSFFLGGTRVVGWGRDLCTSIYLFISWCITLREKKELSLRDESKLVICTSMRDVEIQGAKQLLDKLSRVIVCVLITLDTCSPAPHWCWVLPLPSYHQQNITHQAVKIEYKTVYKYKTFCHLVELYILFPCSLFDGGNCFFPSTNDFSV